MAARKRAPKGLTAKALAARQKKIDRSRKEVEAAHRNLELKLKKHKRTLSAMFFVP